MKLEDQVVSLELAKRLKELGVRQHGEFYWCNPENSKGELIGDKWVVYRKDGYTVLDDDPSAFTVAELGEMLPWTVYTRRTADESKAGRIWNCFHNPRKDEFFSECDLTEADARAKMLIYLIEKGLVKP